MCPSILGYSRHLIRIWFIFYLHGYFSSGMVKTRYVARAKQLSCRMDGTRPRGWCNNQNLWKTQNWTDVYWTTWDCDRIGRSRICLLSGLCYYRIYTINGLRVHWEHTRPAQNIETLDLTTFSTSILIRSTNNYLPYWFYPGSATTVTCIINVCAIKLRLTVGNL